MSLLREIRDAGLTRPFIGMSVGILLLTLIFPGNLPGYAAGFLWILLMMVCALVYRNRLSGYVGPIILLIPMLAGYVVHTETTVISSNNSFDMSIGPFLIGMPVIWMSFAWLIVALSKDRGSTKLKNDEKAKP